ncbi:MAG: hypothetical protein FJ291_13860 [Planctomycetes bacterium]|nr:hypothetical protein [Planctomycetota bacterium]
MGAVCPTCSARELEIVRSRAARIQFLNDRKCRLCGTVWSVPCPRWAAVLAVVLGAGGFLCVATGLVLGHSSGDITPGHPGYAFGMVLWIEVMLGAASAAIYGACVLAGAAGGQAVLRAGEVAAPAAEQAPAPRPRDPRGEVRWFLFPIAALLPIVGLPWGLIDLLNERWRTGILMIAISVLSLAFIFFVLLTLVLAYAVPMRI